MSIVHRHLYATCILWTQKPSWESQKDIGICVNKLYCMVYFLHNNNNRCVGMQFHCYYNALYYRIVQLLAMVYNVIHNYGDLVVNNRSPNRNECTCFAVLSASSSFWTLPFLQSLFKFGSQGQHHDVIVYTEKDMTKPAKLAAYAAERTIILES